MRRAPGAFNAVIFDLDDTLLARDAAWRYTIEEAVISVTGERIDAGRLSDAYRDRPWRHALAVVVPSAADVAACEQLCRDIYERSAMKRLLVQEGIGMALDVLRGASIEIGAVSREPHPMARRQVDSTGLDRFLTLLSATPPGERWHPAKRADDCRAFLGWAAERCAFVSGRGRDLAEAAAAGYQAFSAGWGSDDEAGAHPALASPADVSRFLD